jgi:glutamine synthetase
VISIFLGEELSDILDSLAEGRACASPSGACLEIGLSSLPKLPRDLTDRNRTSPFAFTGNKFEFRMVASSQSVATPATILSAAVAQVLASFADRLEAAAARGEDAKGEMSRIVIETWKGHRRVVFNGNGYSADWAREAERRGLPRFRSAVDAIPEFASAESVLLFSGLGVFSREELESRCLIYLERYAKQINIEAGVMIDMARRSIFPAASRNASEFARAGSELAASGAPSAAQERRARRLAELCASLAEGTERLEAALAAAQGVEESLARAKGYRESVVPRMDELRQVGDELERLMDAGAWPFPSYEELLFKL